MQNSHATSPIAIVGMACRLPGAGNLDAYWQLIRTGASAVVDIPPERLDRELYYDPERGVTGKCYSLRAGLVDYPPFDPQGYNFSPQRIKSTDDGHLAICDVAAQALRHAGMDPFALRDRNCGVYIGHTGGSPLAGELVYATLIEETAQYLHEIKELGNLAPEQVAEVAREIVDRTRSKYPHRDADGGPDIAANVGAGIISRAFGLTGPYMVIDAACASSLKALMLGARALQQGRLDMAIVGGASYCKTVSMILFSHAQSVSATDSRPFDADADGLIASEGYVAVVLKTLDRALADGDPIHAVVRGMGMSSDGKGKSLWAPRKEGQAVAVQRAYSGGIDPARVQFIEAHATSTQLGDATELSALAESLTGRVPQGTKIPLGSVKANIGHTLETAGIAGLVKTVLSLQNKVVPPAINVKNLNPKLDWNQVPFFVPTQEQPWPEHADGHPRRAAVNAFGIGGLNIHVVLDEYLPAQPASFYQQPSTPGTQVDVKQVSPEEPIAVIGMGNILPGAHTVEAFWDLLVSGRDPMIDAPADRWDTNVSYDPNATGVWRSKQKRGGFLHDYEYDWRAHKVPPKQIKSANPMQFMLLDATDQAMNQAGYGRDRQFDRTRVGAVVGAVFGGDFADRLQMGMRLPEFHRLLTQSLADRGVPEDQIQRASEEYKQLLLSRMPALLDDTGSFTSSTLASRITKTFDLMGGALALDAGTSSGLAAMWTASDILRSGECDMVICAAGQRNMDLVLYEGFSMAGMMAEGEGRPPFDAGSNGIIPGEGVAVVILKRESDARRDGDPIQSIIRGMGAGANPDHAIEATKLAMSRALTAARVEPEEVVAIDTTSLGRPNDDPEEVEAIASVYGKQRRAEPVVIDTVIGQTGHTGATSGLASVIKASLSVEHNSFPGGKGIENAAPSVRRHADTLKTNGSATPVKPSASSGRALVGVTAGSGSGLSFHALIERGDKVLAAQPSTQAASPRRSNASAAPAADLKIIRFGSSSMVELTQTLSAQLPQASALFATPQAEFSPQHQVRAAIVAASAEDLAAKLKLAAQQISSPQSREVLERKGIFCRQIAANRPRIAFLFPGQSSQYEGMLQTLIAQSPAAAEAMRQADAAMAAQRHPSFGTIAWENGDKLGSDVWLTQISVLLADTIMHAAISSIGIKPDLVAGHSYGEFPALVAAGAWTLDEAIRITRIRCELVQASQRARGAMLATTLAGAAAEDLVRQLGGDLYVANYNAPDQTVLAGSAERIATAEAQVKALGYNALPISVPCAFHTPLLGEVVEAFRPHVAGAALAVPRIPVLGTTNNRQLTTPDEIKASLANQLVNPVRYTELISGFVSQQDTVLVEVGPQQVLSRIHKRILPEDRYLYIASDNARRPGVEQLYCVRALLECTGALDQPAAPSAIAPARPATPSTPQQPATPKKRGKLHHHDATQRRKEKTRNAAAAPPAEAPAAPAAPLTPPSRVAPVTPVAAPTMPLHSGENGSMNGSHAPSQPAVEQAAAAQPVASSTAEGIEDLESYLIKFVVDETGYPPEIVELDADLEGDLGIDSIKKAQLFGELGEHFGIMPSEDLSMDDYTTLRHVMDFIQSAVGSGQTSSAPAPAAVAAPANPTAASPAAVASQPTPQTAPAAPVASTPAVTAPVQAAPTSQSGNSPLIEDLETFLVKFVVDETGYPPEIVELDADLEGDLGIDSIKKAQLFGELGEMFGIMPSEDLSMDDYTTLRHVMEFIQSAIDTGQANAVTPAAAPAPPAPAPNPSIPSPAVAPLAPTDNSAGLTPTPTPTALPMSKTAATPAPITPSAPSVAGADLETFLINFVVEETGYPPEIVELDADLEGDLGIDSIKKAQLFGELGERFGIMPSEDLSMDDYTTLRHVMDFIQDAINSGQAASAGSAAPSAPAAPISPAPISPVATSPVPTASAPPASAPTPAATLPSPSATPLATTNDAPLPLTPTPMPTNLPMSGHSGTNGAPATATLAPATNATAVEDLESFLINFVVEETGYPPEIVELDADLEGDLGIDSIKKAQLFGELGETFGIVPSEDLSMDDYTTLRHVMDFIAANQGNTPAATGAPALEPAPPTPAPVETDAVAPAAPVASAAPSVPVSAPQPAAIPAVAANVAGGEELETFLINFVVEETGYPPEIVELDADLEGDLGIDSIKKAQLFGELGERFGIMPSEDLSMDDYTTLRHVMEFIEQYQNGAQPAAAGPVAAEPVAAQPAVPTHVPAPPAPQTVPTSTQPSPPVAPLASENGHAAKDHAVDEPSLNVTRLTGTPYEMGAEHGSSHRDEIRKILRWLADQASVETPQFPISDNPLSQVSADEQEELRGIAEGAEVPVASIRAINAFFHEASRQGMVLAVTSGAIASGDMLHAVNEHLLDGVGLPAECRRFAQLRFPQQGIPHVILSMPGQLGGLCGMNAKGVTVSSTKLLDTQTASEDSAKSLPLVVKAILESADSVDAGVELVRSLPRSGASGLCISQHATDQLCYLEFNTEQVEVLNQQQGIVATNHSLLRTSASEVPADSRDRLTRLQGWYQEWLAVGNIDQLHSALQRNFEQSTNGHHAPNDAGGHGSRLSIVIRPASGDLWMLPSRNGHEPSSQFSRLNVNGLISPAAPQPAPQPATQPPTQPPTQPAPSMPATHEIDSVSPGTSDPASRVMKRFILRVTESPVEDNPHADLPFQGPALILGNNRRADALRARLLQLGCVVYDLPDSNDPDEVLGALDAVWQRGPAPHLFVMTACNDLSGDAETDEPTNQSATEALLAPFEVCRRWTELVENQGMQSQSTLVAATMLGGDLGLVGGTPHIAGGGLTGLLKSVRREFEHLGIKIIDVSPNEKPVATADAIVTELASGRTEMEVGYKDGCRWVVEAIEQPAAARPGTEIRQGGVWIFTGGARGVTAVAAQALGKRYGLKLHLVGSSPLPEVDPSWRNLSSEETAQLKTKIMLEAKQSGDSPVAAWDRVQKALEIEQNMQAIEADGTQVTYHSCDVTDRAQVARLVETIRHADGPIEGIVHGAGVDFSCRLGAKKRPNTALTIGAKVDGALNLLACTEQDPLRYFIGFGSNSGRFGGHGQADYSLASDMLCKLSGWIRSVRGDCAACGFHWPSWSEVGMAMRPAIRAGLEKSGLGFVTPEEGVDHLVDELESGMTEQEILILDAPHFLDLDGTMSRTASPAASPAHEPVQAAPSVNGAVPTSLPPKDNTSDNAAAAAKLADSPMIDSIEAGAQPGELVARATLDPANDIFLTQHRFEGKPFMPAVVTMELFCEAAACAAPQQVVLGTSNVDLPNGFTLHRSVPQPVEIRMTPTATGFHCKLVADCYNAEGSLIEANRVYASGDVDLGSERTPIEHGAVGQPIFPYVEYMYPPEGFVIVHGEPLRCLKSTAFQHDGGRSNLVARAPLELAGTRTGQLWQTPSAMIDGCLVSCGTYGFAMLEGRVEIPSRIDRLRVVRLPRDGESCTQRFYFRGIEENGTNFDFVVFGEDGQVIFTLEGYHSVKLDTGNQ